MCGIRYGSQQHKRSDNQSHLKESTSPSNWIPEVRKQSLYVNTDIEPHHAGIWLDRYPTPIYLGQGWADDTRREDCWFLAGAHAARVIFNVTLFICHSGCSHAEATKCYITKYNSHFW